MPEPRTHITNIIGRIKLSIAPPTDPVSGDEFFDTDQKGLFIYSGNNWLGLNFSSTSSSTSTTTSSSTSTSTSSTSSSTSTSTSSSTSTTTTL